MSTDMGAIDMARIAAEAEDKIARTIIRKNVQDEFGKGMIRTLTLEALMCEHVNNLNGAPIDKMKYPSYAHLVLAEGEYHICDDLTLPEGIEPMPTKECFRNAYYTADAEDLLYCEGYAMTQMGLPVLHAWCVDVETWAVVDPTWATLMKEYPETKARYLGMSFDLDFVRRRTMETEHWGIIGNDWMKDSNGRRSHALADGFLYNQDGDAFAYGDYVEDPDDDELWS